MACDTPDVDPAVFYALNDNSIVYDGRVVVGADFRTSDANIYAAGSVAKFSRRLGTGSVPMEYCNAREVRVTYRMSRC